MSRINDYVIGEQEAGRMPVEDEPLGPEIVLEDSVPIPDSLLERSDLNEKFGNLPKTIDKMEKGQSFALSGYQIKSTQLYERESLVQTKNIPTGGLLCRLKKGVMVVLADECSGSNNVY